MNRARAVGNWMVETGVIGSTGGTEQCRPALPCEPPSETLLRDGATAYARMLELIHGARESVDLETYIYRADSVGDRFRAALTAAAVRGVRVRVLVDDYGSDELPRDYFVGLVESGGAVRRFNPRRGLRLSFRNHRKLLRCDAVAVIGGINVGDEYDGNGVVAGWRDFALEVRTAKLVEALAHSFDRMWTLAPFMPRDVRAFWSARRPVQAVGASGGPEVLFSGAGWPSRRMRAQLVRDIRTAQRVCAWVAYFLPSRRLGRALRHAARRGDAQVLLGRHTDVPLARWAAERQFGRFLRSGVGLHQYGPQVVHAKVLVTDDKVFIGSANLDVRSLRLNFELLVRLPDASLAADLRAEFERDLEHSEPIDLTAWRRSRRWWHATRSWVAHLLLARIDPFLAERRLDALR